MLPSGSRAHILPPSTGRFWLGFRFHSSPQTIQSLPLRHLGLHPSAQRSPVASGYSAACRLGDSWPTRHSFSFGPSPLPDVGSEEARVRAGHRPPPKLHVRFSRMQLSRRLNDAEMLEKELTQPS